MDDGGTTPATPRRGRLRRTDIGWFLVAVVVVGVIAFLYRSVQEEADGRNVVVELADGKRPLAPELPVHQLAGTPGFVADVPRDRRWTDAVDTRRAAGPTIVYFWASWCGPCRIEAPMMQRLATEFRDDQLEIVAINASDEDLRSDALDFIRSHKLRFPVVASTINQRRLWGVKGYPETFIVGRDGRITMRIPGAVDETVLRRALKTEIKARPAASATTGAEPGDG
jgi:cytochrome c biogenesis protein CcmG/thiol:disulfide interchange protein DsbE